MISKRAFYSYAMINKNKKGFTLVEILVVLAIVGILLAILVPSVSNIKTSVLKTKSKTQFRQYAMALDAYYQEHEHFPVFLTEKGEVKVNLKDHGVAFQNALKGKYHDFAPSEFAGSGEHEGKIVDAFNNPNIYILVDSNEDGMLETPELHEGKPMRARLAVFTSLGDGPEYESIECTL